MRTSVLLPALAVAGGDYKTLTRAPGVGPKLAQRIVLEMKDKVGALQTSGGAELPQGAVVSAAGNAADNKHFHCDLYLLLQ